MIEKTQTPTILLEEKIKVRKNNYEKQLKLEISASYGYGKP